MSSSPPEQISAPVASAVADIADAVAAAVTACPAVAALSGGVFGQVATYLPGRRVTGVRVGDTLDVHVVGVYGVSIPVLATQVHAATAPHAGRRPVHVHVEDLLTVDELPAGTR